METKPGLTKNDALVHQTLSKKTGVRGRLYLLTTGGLIGVGQRGGSPRSRFRGWTSGSIKPAVGFLDHYLSLVVQPDLE